MDIGSMPVKITRVGERGETRLMIGDIPAAIIEPKPTLTHMGIVYINTVDFKQGKWEELIEADVGDRVYKGCTKDPRLLEIAKKVQKGEFSQEDVGTIYPPLS
jgi:hypothetical protein